MVLRQFTRFAAATLAVCLLATSAYALDAPYDHYVFVPNRNSADVAIIDSDTDKLVARVKVGNTPHQIAVSETLGKMIASNTHDNTISIIDLKTLKTVRTVSLGHEPEHMAIGPGGGLAAIGNIGEGTVSLVSLKDDKEIKRITGLFEPHNMTFSPNGKLLFVGNLGANFVSVIDVAKGKVVNEIPVGENTSVAALPGAGGDEHQGIINVTRTPDGRLGFAAFGDGDVMAVLDLRTQKKIATLKLGDEPWRAYTTADGRFMIVPNHGDKTVSVFSTTAPFKEVARLKGAADMTGVNTGWFETTAFVISRGDNKIVMLDLVNMKNIGEIKLPNGTPETAVVNPQGTKLYVALSGTNEVAIIDTRYRKLLGKVKNVGKEPWGAHMVGALNYCH